MNPSPINVNYENVKVYSRSSDIPFIEIAKLLNNDHKVTVNKGGCWIHQAELIPYIHHERLECILSNETHGLDVFVGVYRTHPLRGSIPGDVPGDVHGVCILTPRIKIERDRASSATLHPLSTSIYVCDHLAWSRYDVNDRKALELLETTEYIQKSREIAGEQTLYRYNEIPWFVIPFTTVYTYALSLERLPAIGGGGRGQRGRDRKSVV